MTRTDALIASAIHMLEQFRPMLDSSASIKCVTLDLKIRPDNTVHTMTLSPGFETHPVVKRKVDEFDFAQ